MIVHELEHGRFHVESESIPGMLYLVDLFPDPKCSCPDFGVRVEARHEKPECKHVRVCYQRFGRIMADEIRKSARSPFAPEMK